MTGLPRFCSSKTRAARRTAAYSRLRKSAWRTARSGKTSSPSQARNRARERTGTSDFSDAGVWRRSSRPRPASTEPMGS